MIETTLSGHRVARLGVFRQKRLITSTKLTSIVNGAVSNSSIGKATSNGGLGVAPLGSWHGSREQVGLLACVAQLDRPAKLVAIVLTTLLLILHLDRVPLIHTTLSGAVILCPKCIQTHALIDGARPAGLLKARHTLESLLYLL